MEITSDKNEMVFRKDYNGKPSYTIGLQKKNKEGEYVNGYIKANFRKGVDLNNKTKIKIKNGWLDFYKDGDKTVPTLFIDDFTVVQDENPYKEMSVKTEFEFGKQLEITDDDLPWN